MSGIPECLAGLKRPELQALCKKYKIKANMKNVDMIAALNEYRDQINDSDKPVEARAQPTLTQPRKSDVSLQSVANSIASKKQRSLGEPTEEELMETSLTEEKKEIQQPSKTCDEMKTSEPEPFEGPRHNGSSATFNTSSDIKIAIQVNSSSASSSSVTQQHCEEDDKKNNNINVQVKFDTTPNGNINVREVSISPTKEENNDDDPEEPFDTSANELSIGNMVSPIKPTGNLSTLVINDDNNNVLSSNTTGQAVPTTDDGNDESSKLNETFTITSPEKDIVNPVSGLTGLSESLCLTPNQKSGTPLRGVWALRESENTPSFLCETHSPKLEKEEEEETKREEEEEEIKKKEEEEEKTGGGLSLARDTGDPVLSLTHGEKENKDAHDEIMSILNSRVEEIKSRPDYVPPAATTKIPISTSWKQRSNTTRRFDALHRKEFAKMTPITDIAQRRKRPNTESTPCEKPQKKQKVETQKTPLTGIKRKTTSSTLLSSKKKPINVTFTKDKPTRPPFKP